MAKMKRVSRGVDAVGCLDRRGCVVDDWWWSEWCRLCAPLHCIFSSEMKFG